MTTAQKILGIAVKGGSPTNDAMSKPSSLISWNTDTPKDSNQTVSVVSIDHFSARGMRRMYGRCDHLGGGFNLDIWRRKDGRFFMRCWSAYSDYWPASFEIMGVNPPLPKTQDGIPLSEDWIPLVVRNAYEDWVREEF